MAHCSILIVTYNSRAVIDSCLESLEAQTCADWEAIIVDNASTDGTREFLQRTAVTTQLIGNCANRGFPAALNQALCHASGEFVLTLNPDVVLEPSCLERLLRAFASADERVGMLSPKLLRVDSQTIDSTGLLVSRAWRVRDRGAGEPDRGQFDGQREILGPCAAAGMYRRAMLDSLRHDGQSFDETFFLLMEDVDLAWRAQRAGWQAHYVPTAVAYHRGGISRHWSWRAQRLALRNRYYLIAKHHRWSWRDAAWLLGYDMPRLGWVLLTNPYTLRTLWELAHEAPRLVRARREQVHIQEIHASTW